MVCVISKSMISSRSRFIGCNGIILVVVNCFIVLIVGLNICEKQIANVKLCPMTLIRPIPSKNTQLQCVLGSSKPDIRIKCLSRNAYCMLGMIRKYCLVYYGNQRHAKPFKISNFIINIFV